MPDRLPELRVALDGAPATADEAAAAIAAVERFLRDHAAPPEGDDAKPVSGWVRAAREEAVDRL